MRSKAEKTGSKYDRMQLKNHWDTMGRQWKVWSRLVQCSYMNWDPETNTFGASDEDWINYVQDNPEAGQYRMCPPQYLEKLEIIFSGNEVDAIDDEVVGMSKRASSRHEEDRDTGDEDRQSMSKSSTPQPKGYWSPSTHELFLDLLVQETLKGNRPDSHLTKEGWKTILETINDKTGLGYTRAQLKNHWDCTRKSWKIWCQLVGISSLKWDPDSRTFGATDEEWRSYLRVNPRASQFRNKQIPHPDKLAIIFHGIIEPGAPYSPPRRKRKRSETLNFHDPTPLSILQTNEAAITSPDGDEIEIFPTIRPRISICFQESRLREGVAIPIDREVNQNQRSEAVESRSNVHESPVSVRMASGEPGYTIGECIECLDAMEEVEQGSDLYLFALDMFLKKEYREIFLQLRKPCLRVAWLQRLQSGGPTISP
ncbi:PREDICTED: L10-interacting MYB domain-containing protein-like isoform X2 [Tarenaya hassleriana]|uniref:L10-interacting MYB domain-containing protein-like isoform X2 n=1 Tax=Tarenaya hassleriana TaxID=28532 RepID=UPI00053C76DE|nr:PREDICTED: L10-interacting MYB domain-containing protein-like isoform X2 [Tarenaya hassleriana]XP_010552867.1 PREDICTED: L10-interacting MYB domain-containing protein-like isoform X2 [Tarenaya hassleriana]